jgi:putative endonuclease
LFEKAHTPIFAVRKTGYLRKNGCLRNGSVVQLVRMPPCHGGGRGFESRPVRKSHRNVGLLYFRSLKHFYVYIIQSELDNSFYKGFTTNYLNRLDEHNLGFSDYTSRKRPWKLVYVEEFPSKTEALKKEIRLKKQNTKYILWLIQQPSNLLRE